LTEKLGLTNRGTSVEEDTKSEISNRGSPGQQLVNGGGMKVGRGGERKKEKGNKHGDWGAKVSGRG